MKEKILQRATFLAFGFMSFSKNRRKSNEGKMLWFRFYESLTGSSCSVLCKL